MKRLLVFVFAVVLLGSCEKRGCTDPIALNYDVNATKDNGSCMKPHLTISNVEIAWELSGCDISTHAHVSANHNDFVVEKGFCWSSSPNPTIEDDTVVSSYPGSNYHNTCRISGLLHSTCYYFRAYATDAYGITSYGEEFSLVRPPCVGDTLKGGIVAFDNITGDWGQTGTYPTIEYYIAAPNDLTPNTWNGGAAWGCFGDIITCGNNYAEFREIGRGITNTNYIVGSCNWNGVHCTTPGIAADICVNYTNEGYSDWFLPSMMELYEMFRFKNIIGGFNSGMYWSSTQRENYTVTPPFYGQTAWAIDFDHDPQYSQIQDVEVAGLKTLLLGVRPLRRDTWDYLSFNCQ